MATLSTDEDRPLSRVQIALLATAAAVCAGSFLAIDLTPPAWWPIFDNLHWVVAYGCAAAVATIGWRRARGRTRRSRGWFAAAMIANAVGQVTWAVQAAVGWAPLPGPCDAGFVLLGPLIAAGVWSHLRGASDGERLAAKLDIAALTIVVLTLCVALYLPGRADVDLPTRITLVIYPTSLLSAAGMVMVACLERRLRLSAPIVGLAVGVIWTGVLYMIWNAHLLAGTTADGSAVNAQFSIATLVLGAAVAAWSPRGVRTRALWSLYRGLSRALPIMIASAGAIAVGIGAEIAGARDLIDLGAAVVVVIAVTRQSLLLVHRDQLLNAERSTREAEARLRHAVERRAELEAQLAQAHKLEALGTLAGGIAHDFNNILMAIYGHAQLVGDAPLSSQARASLDDIRSGCERGRDVVKRMLATARPREPVHKRVHLGDVAVEAASLLRAALPAMISIRAQVDRDLPDVQGDPAQLHEVVMNLATNAWHAIGSGSGAIEISARVDGDHVVLAVADDGCGMDVDTRARIFEPFFTTKGPERGTGLGLSMVTHIVASHGGTIDVASAPGRGTTFRVLLPAKAPLPVADDPTPPMIAAPRALRPDGREILVVDDESTLVRLLSAALERLGWRACATESPAHALSLVSAEPDRFAALITDLTMPVMDGMSLARLVRERAPEMPILLSTGGFDESETPERGLVSAVLQKPYNREELAAVLARCLASSKSVAR